MRCNTVNILKLIFSALTLITIFYVLHECENIYKCNKCKVVYNKDVTNHICK